MRFGGKSMLRSLSRGRARFGRTEPALAYVNDEPPLRSELFSSDQMKQHGKVLAKSHQLSSNRASDRLLTRLAENEKLLLEIHSWLTADVKTDRRITPAGL